MPGDDVLPGAREPVQRAVAFDQLGEVVQDRKRAASLHMSIEVRRVGREHHVPAARGDADALQPLGVAADTVDGHARRDLVVAVVKRDAAREYPLHHARDIVRFERVADHVMAHVAPGRILHLRVLKMEARVVEQLCIAAVVVMHMRDDDVAHIGMCDAERLEPALDRVHDRAAGLRGHLDAEPGIDDEDSVLADHRPPEIVERHIRRLVQIRADEVAERPAVQLGVFHRIDFV